MSVSVLHDFPEPGILLIAEFRLCESHEVGAQKLFCSEKEDQRVGRVVARSHGCLCEWFTHICSVVLFSYQRVTALLSKPWVDVETKWGGRSILKPLIGDCAQLPALKLGAEERLSGRLLKDLSWVWRRVQTCNCHKFQEEEEDCISSRVNFWSIWEEVLKVLPHSWPTTRKAYLHSSEEQKHTPPGHFLADLMNRFLDVWPQNLKSLQLLSLNPGRRGQHCYCLGKIRPAADFFRNRPGDAAMLGDWPLSAEDIRTDPKSAEPLAGLRWLRGQKKRHQCVAFVFLMQPSKEVRSLGCRGQCQASSGWSHSRMVTTCRFVNFQKGGLPLQGLQ